MHHDDQAQLPASFFELVRTSPVPVLVEFWAEWCGPCRIVSPTIERLAHEFSGRLLTVKVNIDRKPLVAQAYAVQGIPTIMLFWKAQPRMRLTGAYPYEEIRRNLQENWPRDADGSGPAGPVAASADGNHFHHHSPRRTGSPE